MNYQKKGDGTMRNVHIEDLNTMMCCCRMFYSRATDMTGYDSVFCCADDL